MEVSTYVALSGQLALERRMATLAGNIANANSAGFKAGRVSFESLLTAAGQGGTAFATHGRDELDLSYGGIKVSKNPLDIAVNGPGFLSYQTPDSQIYHSRDGRLSLSADGQLRNLNGDALLDISGAPLQIDPSAGEITVTATGSIAQGDRVMGQIGLYGLNFGEGFVRHGASGFVTTAQPEVISDFTTNSIAQGYVEGSNVNPVTEMVNLIEVSRAFEAASTFADKALEAERNAIEALGAR